MIVPISSAYADLLPTVSPTACERFLASALICRFWPLGKLVDLNSVPCNQVDEAFE